MRETIRFDESNLCPAIPGIRFNCSLIESGDEFLFVFRNAWKRSEIYAAWLDKDFKPTGRWRKIELPIGNGIHGNEDPRWFRLNNQLYLWYVRFMGRSTHINYARINEETLEVEQRHWPVLYGGNRYEKNWQAVDHDGVLHFVHTINPHIIIKSPEPPPGDDPVVTVEHNTPFNGKVEGTMRGGATPVLHNGEMYSFYHGHTRQDNGRRLYFCSLYTFSPEPPFQILRYTPSPIDIADPRTTPASVPVDVIFPGSATIVGSDWAIAMGVCDLWSEIRFYDRAWIESRMVKHDTHVAT